MKEVNIISTVVGRGADKNITGKAPSMGAYALKSDVSALQTLFNDFLEGDDTDNVINKWKELEAFLNGISEDNQLTSILSGYIPISGYTEILGEKNFVGGLKVNGSPIYYDKDKKYWKFEGDLLVTGGVSMYSNDTAFTPSTIMDAISVDGTTISKEGGVLKVIGAVGGATTLGSLANVGSWADSVAPQDRIMYQAANSSQWVAKNLSDLAVGGVTGDYLPLSGGELSGSLAVTAIQNGYWAGGIRIDGTTSKYPSVGFHIANVAGSRLYVNESFELIFEWSTYNPVTRHKVLHSGNYYNYALPLSGGILTGDVIFVSNSESGSKNSIFPSHYYHRFWANNDVYVHFYENSLMAGTLNSVANLRVASTEGLGFKSLKFSGDGTFTWDYNTIWHSGNDGSGSGLDADLLDGKHYSDIINGNVASATKLQTPRTIWGQSFDGTSNLIGTANIGQNTNGTATIDAFGGVAYFGCDAVVNGSIISTTGAYIAINGKNGNVGIGTPNPSAKLHVGGDILATGGITMYSARKLKNITDERGLSLKELSVIKPTRFTWKDGRDDKVHIGGIADDVMKVLPEVIYKTGEDDTLTMDYGNAAFAIAASLIKPVVSHEERIRLLEEENKRLKEEIEQLKWNIA